MTDEELRNVMSGLGKRRQAKLTKEQRVAWARDIANRRWAGMPESERRAATQPARAARWPAKSA